MTDGKYTRRETLRAASAVFTVPYLIPSHVLGAAGRPGANDKVNVAIIGLGGRARGVASTCLGIPEMRIVAVCDCYGPLCRAFATAVGKDQNWSTYDDFDKMYDKE